MPRRQRHPENKASVATLHVFVYVDNLPGCGSYDAHGGVSIQQICRGYVCITSIFGVKQATRRGGGRGDNIIK